MASLDIRMLPERWKKKSWLAMEILVKHEHVMADCQYKFSKPFNNSIVFVLS